MSSETLAHDVAHGDHDEHAAGHAHPDDKKYVVVALILGLFTAVYLLEFL